jgi:hypothetical protein
MMVFGKGVGQRMEKSEGISSLLTERLGNKKARGAQVSSALGNGR